MDKKILEKRKQLKHQRKSQWVCNSLLIAVATLQACVYCHSACYDGPSVFILIALMIKTYGNI